MDLSWPLLTCPDRFCPNLFWTKLSVCEWVCEWVSEFIVYWDADASKNKCFTPMFFFSKKLLKVWSDWFSHSKILRSVDFQFVLFQSFFHPCLIFWWFQQKNGQSGQILVQYGQIFNLLLMFNWNLKITCFRHISVQLIC